MLQLASSCHRLGRRLPAPKQFYVNHLDVTVLRRALGELLSSSTCRQVSGVARLFAGAIVLVSLVDAVCIQESHDVHGLLTVPTCPALSTLPTVFRCRGLEGTSLSIFLRIFVYSDHSNLA